MARNNGLITTPEDRRIFGELRDFLCRGKGAARPIGELAVQVGRFFLGRPYAGGTLERRGAERLIVNLRQFDCFTLVENAAVIARLISSGKTGFPDYTAALMRARYRGGRPEGYASRLHYFADWLIANRRKGLLRDVTRRLGGIPRRRRVNFMTSHPGLYPALKDPRAFREMRAVEARCSRRQLHTLPKDRVKDFEDGIEDGDLIGITTDREGLDIAHAGLAVRLRGRVHLLHASSAAGRVLLAQETLGRYLAAKKSRTGIIVGRLSGPEAACSCLCGYSGLDLSQNRVICQFKLMRIRGGEGNQTAISNCWIEPARPLSVR